MNKIDAIIAKQGFALADGAVGTNLFAKGLETGDAPELWNIHQIDKITQLHEEFVAAGSDIILTNSFGGTSYRMKLHQAEGQVDELNIAAAQIARSVADRHNQTRDIDIVVAGSMGPTGELFAPLGALDREGAIAAFTSQAKALAKGGADVLWVETMSSVEEVEAAVVGAQSTGLPVYVTMTFDTAGRTMMGIIPADFAKQSDELAVAGFGANCGIGPAELLDTVFGLGEGASDDAVIIAKGNCGIPQYVEGAIHYHGTPELMADYARTAYGAGARIIGGCCGTSAAHVAAMRDALNGLMADKSADDEIMTRDRAAAILGEPWANVPKAPEKGATTRTRRRRRS